ncbi:MAG: DoxX family membrane protein [Halobacteriaceae archaeon]
MATTDARTDERFQVSTEWFGPALVVLRVILGWHLFYAGLTKLLNPGWSAEGFLLHAIPKGNPIPGFWPYLANNWLWLINPLNEWGLTLIGFGLIIGGAVRWNAFWGSVTMLFYWLASLPLAHSLLIDSHIIYIATLFGLGAFGAGRYLGVDEYVEEWDIVKNNPWLKYFLG